MRVLFLGLIGSAACLSAAEWSAGDLEFFEREVRPLLAERCYECHSVDSKKLKGGLYLDSREGILEGGDSGPAVVPGKPEDSLLIEAVSYANVDLQMPPKSRLPRKSVEVLEKWITLGAPWPPEESAAGRRGGKGFDLAARKEAHWCWKPVAEIEPPKVRDETWPRNAIDRFVVSMDVFPA